MVVEKRYKHTELGNIPDEWVVVEISDVASVLGGGTPSTRINNFWDGDLNWFTPTEVGYDKYLYSSRRKITELGLRNSSAKVLHPGTILLTSRAGIGDLGILKCEAATNQGFQSLIANSRISNEFLYYLMLTKKNVLLQNASGSTFLEISPSKVKSIKIPLPPLPEQTAIATALSDMDALIAQTEKLIEKKKAIIQGVMQELLRPKEGWEKKKISEAFNIFKGRGLSKNKISEYGEYPCILYGELFTTYKEEITEIFSKTNYSEAVNSVEGDILFPGSTTTTGADLAKASAIFKDGVQLGGDIIILRKYDFNLDSLYVTNFLNYYRKNEIAQLTKGITIHHLYGKDLSGIELEFPNQSIQMSISNASRDFDLEISWLQKKLQKLIFEKQGMMQALLTGKIRLV
jgi:type I restriction enzyme S subunit